MRKFWGFLLIASLILLTPSCKGAEGEPDETETAAEESITEAEITTEAPAKETKETVTTEAPTAKPAPVAQTTPFMSDFSKGAEGWTTYGGTWEVKDGAYTVLKDPGAKAVADGTMFDDFTYEADVTVSAGNNGGLIFRVSYPDTGADLYYGYYAGISPTGLIFGKATDAWYELGSATLAIGADTEAHLKVVAKGATFEFYVNDMETPLITVEDDEHEIGAVGVRVYQIDAAFRNIVVTPMPK